MEDRGDRARGTTFSESRLSSCSGGGEETVTQESKKKKKEKTLLGKHIGLKAVALCILYA